MFCLVGILWMRYTHKREVQLNLLMGQLTLTHRLDSRIYLLNEGIYFRLAIPKATPAYGGLSDALALYHWHVNSMFLATWPVNLSRVRTRHSLMWISYPLVAMVQHRS
jgi:hypothetical protein